MIDDYTVPKDNVEDYLDPVSLRRTVRGGDKLKGVQPSLLQHWNGLDDEFQRAGLTPEIKSGFRTAEQQNALFRNPATRARTKGNDGYNQISPHQEGRALDISFPASQRATGRRIIANYAKTNGLTVPSDEPWHLAIPQQGKAPVETYLDPVQTQAPQSTAKPNIEDYLDPQNVPRGTSGTPQVTSTVKEADEPLATSRERIAKPIEFKQGVESKATTLNPVGLVSDFLSQPNTTPQGIAGLQARKYEAPESHQLGERVTLPISKDVTPSEDEVVRGYLTSLGPEYVKAGEDYKAKTGHNILTLGGGALKQNEKGNYYVRPSKGATDFLNTYIQSGGDQDKANAEAQRQADELIAAHNKAFQESKPDVEQAKAAMQTGKESPLLRGMIGGTAGAAQAFGTVIPGSLGNEFERQSAVERAATEQLNKESPLQTTGERIKAGIGGLIPTAAMLIATHKLGPAQLAALGVLEGSTPQERLRGGLQGAAAQGLLGGAPAAFTEAGLPTTGKAVTSAAMVGQPALEAYQRGESPVQAITENLPFAALPFLHSRFGKVESVEDQSGVPKGEIRVREVDNPDVEHVIIKPSSVRNQNAIPVPSASVTQPTERLNTPVPQAPLESTEVPLEAATTPEPGATTAPTTSEMPAHVPLEQLTRAELKQRIRKGGTRRSEYETELQRRYESRNLSGFVRDSGGIVPGDMFRGELAAIGPKEAGTTGLINRNSEAGGGRKMTPEYMMDAANAEGYRNLNGEPFDNIGDFISAVESDFKGRKLYTRLGADNSVDFEREYREQVQREDEAHDADAIVFLLENEESGQIYDRIVEGKANETDIAHFRELAAKESLTPQGTEDLIASARARSFQETPEIQEQPAAPSQNSPIAISQGPPTTLKSEQVQGERSFPKTLVSTEREGGTNLTYDVLPNVESRAQAKSVVDEKGIDKAMDDLRGSGGAQRTALGIELIDRASRQAREAETKGDKVEAATRYAQAAEAASTAAENLTTAGQEVQAAQIATRYSPEGALREAARITKSQNRPFTPEQAKATDAISRMISDSNQRIKDLEQTVSDLRAGKRPRAQTTRIDTVKDYFSRLEMDAKARLEARKGVSISGGEAGASTIPLDLADWTIIGAAKIAKGGLNAVQWQADMLKDLGEQVKPYLDQIFQDATKQVRERRATLYEEAQTRSATRRQKPEQTLADALEELNGERAKNRQARRDLERHFKDLERSGQRKNLDAFLSLTRDSLLSLRGLGRILSGMSGKQAIDALGKIPATASDIVLSKTLGTPRTITTPSFGSLLRTVGGFRERVGPTVKSAFLGKGSEIMPEAYPQPKGESPYVTYTVRAMQKLYGSKEALIRSWAYPKELQDQALLFAKNDAKDGVIKRSEVDQRARDYIRGRVEFTGESNKKLGQSLAEQAAQYEADTKQIIPSMRKVRVKEMLQSPTELLHSVALQSADKSVYAQPSRIATKARGLFPTTPGGQLAQNIVLPFAKRPANNIADNLFGYTGLKTFKEGGKLVKAVINKEFTPAQVKSFNEAVGKGASGLAVMAIGAALAKKGVLTSPLDKNHPASIKVGDKYYAVGYVPVVGWLLGMGAAYQSHGAKSVPVAMSKMILEHPLLRSAKDISEGLTNLATAKVQGEGWIESAEKGAERYAGQTASRIVPAPVKIAAEASDTKERDTSGLTGPLRAGIPGLRQRLPAIGEKPRTSVINPFYTRNTFKQGKTDLKNSFVERLRQGQQVDLDKAVDDQKITLGDRKSIEREAKLSPRQVAFTRAFPNQALDRFERMDANQRSEVRDIMEIKGWSLTHSDSLTAAQKEDFQKRLDALGLEPRDPRKKTSYAPSFKSRFLGGQVGLQ